MSKKQPPEKKPSRDDRKQGKKLEPFGGFCVKCGEYYTARQAAEHAGH
jgi:hypothetical protein